MSELELIQARRLIDAGRATEGVLIVSRLANNGDAAALRTLGELTWGGVVRQDPVAARDLFRRASDKGDRIAHANVTNLLASGVAGPRDWTQAVERLRSEARYDAERKAMVTLIDRMALDGNGDPLKPPAGVKRSDRPEVHLFEHLLTSAECDYLRAVAEKGYEPSIVYTASGSVIRDPIRSSDGSTLHWLIEDPVIHAINRRLAAASGSDASAGEAMQILRYRPGQDYKAHYDYTNAAENERILTALIYLNHDFRGGETAFLDTGLKIRGRKGDVLVFRNALPDGSCDLTSKHAGLPVTQGTKYLASRWIHERRWQP